MINPEPAIIAACDEWYGDEPWNVWQYSTMDRALTAALPHLLAAKDAEIAALRQREAHLRLTPVWLLKAAEKHCEWPAFKHALNAALNAMDERAALEMSGGVK